MGLGEVLNVRKLELACREDWIGFMVKTKHSKVQLWASQCGGNC